ncbi:MAG: hypothetical protein WCL39_02715 [Armatimonadota bacterium]
MSLLTNQKLRDYQKQANTWSGFGVLALLFIMLFFYFSIEDDTVLPCYLTGLNIAVVFPALRSRKLAKPSPGIRSWSMLILNLIVIVYIDYSMVARQWPAFLHWNNYLPHSLDSALMWVCFAAMAICLETANYYGYLHEAELNALKQES